MMWLIRRTKPAGEFLGFAIPVFIRNMQYHLATVNAYADGAIDAWGFLDRDMFEAKLKKGWIWPRPPEGGRISVFNLGFCTVLNGDWLQTVEIIRDSVHEAIKELNPRSVGLVEMHGSDVELRGKVRYAKLGLGDGKPCRIEATGKVIGREVPCFQLSGAGTVLTRVFIFSDGLARVGSQSALLAADEVCRQFAAGELTTSIGNGTRVQVEGLGSFVCQEGSWPVDPRERVRELKAMLAELHSEDNLMHVCVAAFANYEKEPSDDNLSALRLAYENVPEHLRMYCGDMDSKDHPIRRVLFPDEYRDGEHEYH